MNPRLSYTHGFKLNIETLISDWVFVENVHMVRLDICAV
jgi:hypothetical protein